MPDEAAMERTEHGLIPDDEGWCVLNARDAVWHHRPGRPALCTFERWEGWRIGINLNVVQPGESLGLYHAEKDEEAFLVLEGSAVLIVNGEERPLRQWDLFHCPGGVDHMIVGAGDGPALILAVGGREHFGEPDCLWYPVDETAQRHGVCAPAPTHSPAEAYAGWPERPATAYREGWLR